MKDSFFLKTSPTNLVSHSLGQSGRWFRQGNRIVVTSLEPAVEGEFERSVTPSPQQRDLHSVVLDLVARNHPLPAALDAEFRTAAIRLRSLLLAQTFPGSKLNQAHAWSLICMLNKLLESGADDRIILWGKICPTQSPLLGVPNNRCVREFSPINEDLLFKYIKSKADVESAGRKIFDLFYRLKPMFLNIHLVNPRNDNVAFLFESLEQIDWHIKLTQYRLRVLFDENLAPSSRPRYLLAIKNWIAAQQRNPKSIYSC